MLTLPEVLDHIRQTLRSDLSSELQAIEVIDQAGEYLLNMAQWGWTYAPPVTLSLVADQEYIELPADFGEARSLTSANTADTIYFQWVDAGRLAAMRGSAFTSEYGAYFGTVMYPSVSGVPKPRLELYPTPSTSEADVFTLTYRKGWVTPSGDRGVFPIPKFMHTLFIQIVRAFARGYEEEDQASLQERLAEIEASTVFANALKRDGQVQPNLGPLPARMNSGGYPRRGTTYPGVLGPPEY